MPASLVASPSPLTPGSTKKAATTGAIFTGYVVGNIASSYTVIASEASIKYQSAWITIIVSMAVSSICSLLLRWILIRENKRREAAHVEVLSPVDEKNQALGLEADVDAQAPPINIDEYADLTDKQIKGFKYTL